MAGKPAHTCCRVRLAPGGKTYSPGVKPQRWQEGAQERQRDRARHRVGQQVNSGPAGQARHRRHTTGVQQQHSGVVKKDGQAVGRAAGLRNGMGGGTTRTRQILCKR
jgi:hypothetical protein